MITLAIANQKGGVGKTTTAQALAGAFRAMRKRVLLIDLDYQANLTATENKPDSITAYAFFTGKANLVGDFIASNDYSIQLIQELKSKGAIKSRLAKVAGYDICILDTPPALNPITINALYASDIVIIPTSANFYGLQGLQPFRDTIDALRDRGSKSPQIGGIVLTRYSDRTNLAKGFTEALDNLTKALGTRIYTTTIPNGVAVEEAQALKQNLIDYAPNSKPAQAYIELAKEILKGVKK